MSIYNEISIIYNTRLLLTKFTEYMINLKHQDTYLEMYHNQIKSIDIETLKQQKAFYVPTKESDSSFSIPKEFQRLSLGIYGKWNKLIIQGRFVYPVMDNLGYVIGFVGHDPFEDNKYLDVKTLGYTPKRTTCFGMEKTKQYLSTNEPTFFVEGIGCCLYLRSQGFQSYALLGSSVQPYIIEFMKRHTNPVVCPDSDSAGHKLRKVAYMNNLQHYVIPWEEGKDIDDARKNNEKRIITELKGFKKEN